MSKSIIASHPSELATLQGRELLESIRAAQCRTVACEIVAFQPPLVDGVSNAGLAAALGAEIIHLNHYDVSKPLIAGYPNTAEGEETWSTVGLRVGVGEAVEAPFQRLLSNLGMGITIGQLRKTVGRVVGLSLDLTCERALSPPGRLASPQVASRAIEQGAAYLTLVAAPRNPPEALLADIQNLRAALGADVVLVAGRMPWGGARLNEDPFLGSDEIKKLVAAGADVIMLPAPGTAPGATQQKITDLVTWIHGQGALALASIDSSLESAGEDTVRHLTLDAKLTGVDIFQLGDAGYSGLAIPENIQTFATTIKGKRHALRRMAS